MSPVPRIPYGMAKAILATMEIGDACVVRPAWVVSFHNAARRMGIRIAALSFQTKDGQRFRVMRVAEGWPSSHRFSRLPRRNRITGRWKRVA